MEEMTRVAERMEWQTCILLKVILYPAMSYKKLYTNKYIPVTICSLQKHIITYMDKASSMKGQQGLICNISKGKTARLVVSSMFFVGPCRFLCLSNNCGLVIFIILAVYIATGVHHSIH